MNMQQEIINQHLIDPELCIRCNTCEESCPSAAISNDGRNYVVDAGTCNGCLKCVPDCPTGAINHWRPVIKTAAYSKDEQFTWEQLPSADPALDLAGEADDAVPQVSVGRGAPASAAPAQENLYTRGKPAAVVVKASLRLTDAASASDIRHIVLDMGTNEFPWLEGQSIGILPPGPDANGKPHQMRLYSIASARSGERGIKGTLALTVKRVLEDHQGQPHRGVCSNHVCDLRPGDPVQVVGPYGASFLMPEAMDTSLLMICTGTGIAPMRAMIERRRQAGPASSPRQALFYGGRTPQELPYLDELENLPAALLDLNLAFSRTATPKKYVQDLIVERHDMIAQRLADAACYIYVCGLKGMEHGVLEAFRTVCQQHGMAWNAILDNLEASHRLHIETY